MSMWSLVLGSRGSRAPHTGSHTRSPPAGALATRGHPLVFPSSRLVGSSLEIFLSVVSLKEVAVPWMSPLTPTPVMSASWHRMVSQWQEAHV